MQKSKIEKIPLLGVLYQWVLAISPLFFPVVGLFSSKFNRFLAGRVDWRSRLRQSMNVLQTGPFPKSPVVLFHCASVGEFEQARPVIEKLHSDLPGHRMVLSFFSPSGFELRKNYASADLVTYLPLDTKSNVRDFLDAIDPALVVITKYEFWPNFLLECHSRMIPVVSISAVFRKNHFYFKPWGSFFLHALRTVHHFFVQDQDSKIFLEKVGITTCTVSGDTRFDRVLSIREKSLPVVEVDQFLAGRPAMVIGSAWPEDMKILEPIIKKYKSKLAFIVVPHEVDPSSLQTIADFLPEHVRLSAWDKNTAASVLLVDKMGMLSRIYASGMMAWVGGAYGKGLHNILEAAVYGLPVFFGNKNYQKFREARELLAEGSAFTIASTAELEILLEKILLDSEYSEKLKTISEKYVHDNRGATEIIVEFLQAKLNS